MSAGNKSKAKGTREQRRQREMLQAAGYEVMVWAEEGINDKGDLLLTIGDWEVTIECKDAAALNAHGIVEKANRKAPGDAVLWWKRTEQKEGSERRTQVAKPIVCIPEKVWMGLLDYVRELETGGVILDLDQIGEKP